MLVVVIVVMKPLVMTVNGDERGECQSKRKGVRGSNRFIVVVLVMVIMMMIKSLVMVVGGGGGDGTA